MIRRPVFKEFQSIERSLIRIEGKGFLFVVFESNDKIRLFDQPDPEMMVDLPCELVAPGGGGHTPQPEVKFIVDNQLAFLHFYHEKRRFRAIWARSKKFDNIAVNLFLCRDF